MVVPQNGWFLMENPITMDDLGKTHHLRKHPYECCQSLLNKYLPSTSADPSVQRLVLAEHRLYRWRRVYCLEAAVFEALEISVAVENAFVWGMHVGVLIHHYDVEHDFLCHWCRDVWFGSPQEYVDLSLTRNLQRLLQGTFWTGCHAAFDTLFVRSLAFAVYIHLMNLMGMNGCACLWYYNRMSNRNVIEDHLDVTALEQAMPRLPGWMSSQALRRWRHGWRGETPYRDSRVIATSPDTLQGRFEEV